jgi:hypothetical protein
MPSAPRDFLHRIEGLPAPSDPLLAEPHHDGLPVLADEGLSLAAGAEAPAVAILPIPVLVRLVAFLAAEDFLVGHWRKNVPALQAAAAAFIPRRSDSLFGWCRHYFTSGVGTFAGLITGFSPTPAQMTCLGSGFRMAAFFGAAFFTAGFRPLAFLLFAAVPFSPQLHDHFRKPSSLRVARPGVGQCRDVTAAGCSWVDHLKCSVCPDRTPPLHRTGSWYFRSIFTCTSVPFAPFSSASNIRKTACFVVPARNERSLQ